MNVTKLTLGNITLIMFIIIINIYASIHFVHSYYIELFVTGISTLLNFYLNNNHHFIVMSI